MHPNLVDVDLHDGVAQVWLNRPEVHNAFDEHLIAALCDTFQQLDADPAVRVLVLGGRGKSFCAGADLAWMRRMSTFTEAENLRDAGELARMLHLLHAMKKPTVARVHGPALAGGMGLVAACDIALAAPEASFGMTEVRIGLIPATVSPYVLRAIGARAAQRYFLTAERFGAEQAHAMGLVHEVCASQMLDARVDEIVRALLAGGPASQGACKQLVESVADHPIDDALIAETCRQIAQARCGSEARQGIDAFFGKRRPPWLSSAPLQ